MRLFLVVNTLAAVVYVASSLAVPNIDNEALLSRLDVEHLSKSLADPRVELLAKCDQAISHMRSMLTGRAEAGLAQQDLLVRLIQAIQNRASPDSHLQVFKSGLESCLTVSQGPTGQEPRMRVSDAENDEIVLNRLDLAALSRIRMETRQLDVENRCRRFDEELQMMLKNQIPSDLGREGILEKVVNILSRRRLPFGNSQPVLEELKNCLLVSIHVSRTEPKREVIASPSLKTSLRNSGSGAMREALDEFKDVRNNVKDHGQDLYLQPSHIANVDDVHASHPEIQGLGEAGNQINHALRSQDFEAMTDHARDSLGQGIGAMTDHVRDAVSGFDMGSIAEQAKNTIGQHFETMDSRVREAVDEHDIGAVADHASEALSQNTHAMVDRVRDSVNEPEFELAPGQAGYDISDQPTIDHLGDTNEGLRDHVIQDNLGERSELMNDGLANMDLEDHSVVDRIIDDHPDLLVDQSAALHNNLLVDNHLGEEVDAHLSDSHHAADVVDDLIDAHANLDLPLSNDPSPHDASNEHDFEIHQEHHRDPRVVDSVIDGMKGNIQDFVHNKVENLADQAKAHRYADYVSDFQQRYVPWFPNKLQEIHPSLDGRGPQVVEHHYDTPDASHHVTESHDHEADDSGEFYSDELTHDAVSHDGNSRSHDRVRDYTETSHHHASILPGNSLLEPYGHLPTSSTLYQDDELAPRRVPNFDLNEQLDDSDADLQRRLDDALHALAEQQRENEELRHHLSMSQAGQQQDQDLDFELLERRLDEVTARENRALSLLELAKRDLAEKDRIIASQAALLQNKRDDFYDGRGGHLMNNRFGGPLREDWSPFKGYNHHHRSSQYAHSTANSNPLSPIPPMPPIPPLTLNMPPIPAPSWRKS